MKNCREHLRAVVTKSFSDSARIIEIDGVEGLGLMISWRLGTDPKRPAKRSKTIRLLIDAEALEDYAAAPTGHRQMADVLLHNHLQEMLRRFDSDHQAPLGQGPPLVCWSVGTVTLLG